MDRRSKFRALIALAFAISSVAVIVAPAAAATVLTACTGTCGYYEVYDMGPTGQKGAVCVYETGSSYDLDEITIRPPLMHGSRPTKDKVSWRFKIRKQNVNTMVYSTVFTSSYQSAMADDATPAYVGHGFSRRSWRAPENPHGFFYVQIELTWTHNGSREGYAKIEYDWYKAQRSGATDTQPDHCLRAY